jgi:hypothetical protein
MDARRRDSHGTDYADALIRAEREAMNDVATAAFVVIPVLLAAGLVWGVAGASRRLGDDPATRRRAVVTTLVGSAVWMIGTWLAAASGILRQWNATPPPFGVFVLTTIVLSVVIAFTSYGRRLAIGLPLWVLVAVQGFRLPLELAMHEMYERGVMPVQMSYEGSNYDILTGATALVVAAIVRFGRHGRVLVAVWNVFGLALLANVVTIAILGTPRFAYFGSDQLNEWVADPPYVWLPAVMVLAALAGHLVIFRALRRAPSALAGRVKPS